MQSAGIVKSLANQPMVVVGAERFKNLASPFIGDLFEDSQVPGGKRGLRHGKEGASGYQVSPSPLVVSLLLDAVTGKHVVVEGEASSLVDKRNPFIGYFVSSAASEESSSGKKGAVSARPSPQKEERDRLAEGRGRKNAAGSSLSLSLQSRLRLEQARVQPGEERDREEHRQDKETKDDGQRKNDTEGKRETLSGVRGRREQKTDGTALATDREDRVDAVSSLSALASTSRYERDFEEIRQIGSGGQGKVFEAVNRWDGQSYAMKKVIIPCNNSHRSSNKSLAAGLKKVLREVQAMARIPPHRNILRYHAAWIEKDPAYPALSSLPSSTSSSSLLLTEDEVRSGRTLLSVSSSQSSYTPAQYSVNESSRATSSASIAARESTREGMEKQSHLAGENLRLFVQMELVQDPKHDVDITLTSHLGRWNTARGREEHFQQETHSEAMALFRQICQGVHHIHGAGIVHRDLKPDNVFLQGNRAIIGDFGLAKDLNEVSSSVALGPKASGKEGEDPSPPATTQTTELGTYLYASPEQLGSRKRPRVVLDPVEFAQKSDIFALGVILLELCCPFTTMMERVQVLMGVRHGIIPQKLSRRYPAETALMLSMSAPDPLDRPSAGQVLQELDMASMDLTSFFLWDVPGQIKQLSEELKRTSEVQDPLSQIRAMRRVASSLQRLIVQQGGTGQDEALPVMA